MAKIDFQKQRVSLKGKRGGKIYFRGKNSSKECSVISLIEIKNLVRQGCKAYQCCVTEDGKREIKLEDILVIRKFP